MINNCEETFKKYFSFWPHLSDSQKNLICQNAINHTYKKGENIQSGNDNCLGVILVKSGQLRIYILSEDGREITLYRMFEGDTCILSASCILSEITFDVFIDSMEDTEVIMVKSSLFHKLAEENIYVENYSYRLATARFSDVMWAMQQILFMGVDKRLAIFLIDEISKSKSDEIKLTHEQIAKYMGTAREVVSRMLKYFESEGIVELFRGGIKVIDKKKLRSIM